MRIVFEVLNFRWDGFLRVGNHVLEFSTAFAVTTLSSTDVRRADIGRLMTMAILDGKSP